MKKFWRWLIVGEDPEPEIETNFKTERFSNRHSLRLRRAFAIKAVEDRKHELA